MRTIKHVWQRLVQRFKPRASRADDKFDQELSAAGQEQQSLLGQLNGLQSEVEHSVSTVREEQQSLRGQVDALQADVEQALSAAGLEEQALHEQLSGLQAGVDHGLASVRKEQQSLLGQLNSLQGDFERELSAARQEKQALLGQVSGLQDELKHLRSRDEVLRSELQQRFDQLQAERDAAHQETVDLRTSLADFATRQETADTRVNSLEVRLKEQQQQHDAALLQALVRERRQARRLNVAMTVAAAAFVLGIVGSAVNFWEVRNTSRLLAVVSQGIKDIQVSMEVRSTGSAAMSSPGASLAAPETPSALQAPESRPSAVGEASREQEVTEPGLSDKKLPEPDFVASNSLPLGNHSFKSRQDARDFFEENAKQPGVITLPSGLQYRELIPGTGKSPRANDQVMVEYRAFRPDGTETDNSFKKKLPTTFTVDEATPALKEALPQMQVGAQWELYIPSNLAYPGVRKRSPYGFEPLILTVELLSVVAAEPANKP